MRTITVTPSGGGPAFVIGDDNLGRGVGSRLVMSLRFRFSGQYQTIALVRGSEPQSIDRQQETTDVSVDVSYCFSTISECDKFLLDLQTSVPRLGKLSITSTGGGSQTRYLDDCTCRPIEVVEQVGVTAFVRFTFSGGRLSTQ